MTLEQLESKFTRYEIARILGARSLQLAMDAPVLLKLSDEEKEDLNFDTLKTAEKELIAEVLPITVKRPLPERSEKTIKKLSEEEIEEKLKKQKENKEKEIALEKKKVQAEKEEETEIAKKGEIMEIANPDDEMGEEEEESSDNREEIA